MTNALRSIAAVAIGLLLLSLVVEGLEFGLVTLVSGRFTTEPEAYHAVRNQVWFLGLKVLYNGGSAVLAGYATARIAKRGAVVH